MAAAAIVPEEQVGQYTLNKVGEKIGRKPKQSTIITTSLWPKPCQKPGGDQVNRLSILNKAIPPPLPPLPPGSRVWRCPLCPL